MRCKICYERHTLVKFLKPNPASDSSIYAHKKHTILALPERRPMKKPSEINLLKDICQRAKAEGKMTGSNLTRLSLAFGARFTRAWEALKERRVKRYAFKPSGRTIWIVVGKQREYIIMPTAEFCSCDDFYFRVMNEEVHLCYHLIAQKIAEALGWYDSFEEDDALFDSLMKEWKEVTP